MFNLPGTTPPISGTQLDLNSYFQLDTDFPDLKYEYEDGRVWLMSEVTIERDAIAFNIHLALRQALVSKPCSVHGSNVRIQINQNTYYFPDVTVSCDVADRRRGNTMIRSPRLVGEVLSPSTERADRGSKLRTYQTCPTIQEIVLVDQFTPTVEVYQRQGDTWQHTKYMPEARILLKSLDVELSFEDLYRGIDFNEPLLSE